MLVHELPKKNGVNFLLFDNDEFFCAVQHHFSYGSKNNDRFEITLNTGKRMIIERFST